MLFSKRISALEGQVSELTANLSTITAERDDLTTQLGGFEGFISPEAHNAIVAERDAAVKALADLKANMPKQIEAAASDKAIEIAASVGVPPVSAEDPAKRGGVSTVDELRAQLAETNDPTQRARISRQLREARRGK